MAHAFDNRTFVSGKQQTSHAVSSLSVRSDTGNTRWERSTSPRSNQPPPPYEGSVFNKVLLHHQNSKSSARPPLSSNDSSYQQPASSTNHTYLHDSSISNFSSNHSSNTKPPPPTRMPQLVSTTYNNYNPNTNMSPDHSSNETKTKTTYRNTTQLYITQPSSHDNPPPPPPRHPLHPPAIPPRNPSISFQKNSVIIPNFNSPSPLIKRSDFEHRLNSIPDATNESTIGEYFGECCKCGEMITSLDDPCEILGQIYHSSCAICVLCRRSVKNKHFFIKDQLYCEEDFLYTGFQQTLERCVACDHLITDTVLQALGESYHLACFKCSKCLICLDGLPFIRDNKRQLFCLRDYHMTYGPRCDKCLNIIYPEKNSNETVRILSMGKTFHVECYQCQDCSMQLGDEEDCRCYPIGDTLLCQECCHRRRISVNKF